MAQQNSQPPDLATVLRNLAALAPATSAQPAASPSLNQLQFPSTSQTPPFAGHNATPFINNQQTADPRLAGRSQRSASHNYSSMSTTPPGSPKQTPPPQASAPATIDPATITEWAPGLRCVSKIAAQNPNFKSIIQKMISGQHEHEMIWWGGRQPLMTQSTAEQLKAYDMKVHRAQREMFAAMSAQLKGLGVPFFGVKAELIVPAEGQASVMKLGAGSGSKAKITEDELLKLQRKMLQYLEDMYKD